MKNIFEDIKNKVKKTFYPEEAQKEETPQNMENLNTGPVNPGQEESQEDVGKKVFERTGHLREGVAQSSTLEPQETPVKTNQGIKKDSKPYSKKKKFHPGRNPSVKK